ncbi:MAG: hypothetical protein LBU43_02525 [Candidatus Accumulibacter sp.]|jgi:hypothetical protein|nr:hypothetical protein [Accumulibacter sp.]
MRQALLCAIALCAAPAQAALAEGGYFSAQNAQCAVWAPAVLNKSSEVILNYQGECKNGRAEGKGKAIWSVRYAGQILEKAVWEGTFGNGVFLKDYPIQEITPLPNDKYIISTGAVENAKLVFLSTGAQDGTVGLCFVDSLNLQLATDTPTATLLNDVKMEKLFRAAFAHYRQHCPKATVRFDMGIHTRTFAPLADGRFPNPAIQARANPASGEIDNYYNQLAYEAEQDKARERFRAFNRKHGIQAWASLKQLEDNPFRWEGKTVGVIVRLDKMLTRDSALITTATRSDWANAWLTAIPPDFPDNGASILIAARVGERQTPPEFSHPLLTLHHLESHPCKVVTCADWIVDLQDIKWGEPFASHPATNAPE